MVIGLFLNWVRKKISHKAMTPQSKHLPCGYLKIINRRVHREKTQSSPRKKQCKHLACGKV